MFYWDLDKGLQYCYIHDLSVPEWKYYKKLHGVCLWKGYAFLQALMITHIHTKENNLYIFMETEIIRINLVLSNQIEGFLRKNLVDVLDPW